MNSSVTIALLFQLLCARIFIRLSKHTLVYSRSPSIFATYSA